MTTINYQEKEKQKRNQRECAILFFRINIKMPKPSLEERIASKLASENKGNSGSGSDTASTSAFSSGSGSGSGSATTTTPTINASTATAGATSNNIPKKLSKPSMEERIARKLSQEDSKPNSNNNKTGTNLTLTHEERIQRKLAGQDTITTATTAAAGTTPVVANSANSSTFKVDQEEEKEETAATLFVPLLLFSPANLR